MISVGCRTVPYSNPPSKSFESSNRTSMQMLPTGVQKILLHPPSSPSRTLPFATVGLRVVPIAAVFLSDPCSVIFNFPCHPSEPGRSLLSDPPERNLCPGYDFLSHHMRILRFFGDNVGQLLLTPFIFRSANRKCAHEMETVCRALCVWFVFPMLALSQGSIVAARSVGTRDAASGSPNTPQARPGRLCRKVRRLPH